MTEAKREPSFWILKRADGKCWTPSGWADRADADHWNMRERADRFRRKEKLANCQVVAVYVTTRKVKRGHSWAWACKRMLEGKRVRRSSWMQQSSASVDVGYFVITTHSGQSIAAATCADIGATDWELAR